MKRVLGFILFALFALAPYANAGQPRTHDGFFLRLAGGAAFANTSAENGDGGELAFGDIGGDAHFAIGGIVVRNLALHGTIWGWWLGEADGEYNGQDFDSNANVHMSAVGGGLTYYFEPSNIYVSGSVGLAHIEFDVIAGSESGLGFTALVGKEWWVGNSWGLGIAGEVNVHSLPAVFTTDTVDEDWSGVSFGLLLSVTLN